MKRFQNIFRFLVPSWLSEGEGGLVLASLALIKDAFLQRALEGLQARFSSRTGASALALTGEDRGIVRGRSESDAQYARRLIAWRYPRGHRTRGSAFALLSQVVAYWGALLDKANTIDIRGNGHEVEATGQESYSYGNTWNWDGAAPTPNWGRFWVILSPAAGAFAAWPDFGDPALWHGDLNPDDAIGQTGATPGDARTMRRLFEGRAWKPAGTRAEWLVLDLAGLGATPDGTWGAWSKNSAGVQVAARDTALRFWALDAALNEYVGNAANYPTSYAKPGGGTYSGSDVWADDITLVDGVLYAGNSATFPATITLPDDGSPAF